MYYSLTFAGGEKNTWADWRLIAVSPPQIPPPAPNTNIINIPGRVEGPLDMSRVPFGYLTYGRITGSWGFICVEEHKMDRAEIYEAMRKWLHGRETTVRTEDDPFHYYKGRFTISEPSSGENTFEISIGFDLEPRRWDLNGTEDEDFLQR